MVTASSAVCASVPADALKTSVAAAAVSVAATVNEICCGVPGVSVKPRRHGYDSARQAAQRDTDRSGKAIDRGSPKELPGRNCLPPRG